MKGLEAAPQGSGDNCAPAENSELFEHCYNIISEVAANVLEELNCSSLSLSSHNCALNPHKKKKAELRCFSPLLVLYSPVTCRNLNLSLSLSIYQIFIIHGNLFFVVFVHLGG